MCCAANVWNSVVARKRTVTGVWLLLAPVLSIFFHVNLKAMLILFRPRLQLPFDSLEGLLQSRIPTYISKAMLW